MAGFVLALTLLGSGACYRYAPRQDLPAPGAHVRAYLTVDGAIGEGSTYGSSAGFLEGTVVPSPPDELVLDVVGTRGQTAFQDFVFTSHHSIPMREVARIEERRLSGRRTAAMAIGFGIIAIYTIDRVMGAARDPDPFRR